MSLTTYEPWSLLNRFRHDLYRLSERDPGARTGAEASVYDWVPAVDIAESADAFMLSIDVPGIDPAEIDISMVDGVLTIRGERTTENAQQDDRFRRIERRSGKFFRRFELPDTADADSISARSSHGVLEVRIPKQAKAEPRRINIEAA